MPLDRIRFLGTRANIDRRTWRHRRHSALLIATDEGRLMVDCGADWKDLLGMVAPDAILITHAHPDHAWGLADGAPCPVYATPAAWEGLAGFPVAERRMVEPGHPLTILGVQVEAFEVVHSIRAPAVGYRLARGTFGLFYVPDVVAIPRRGAALRGLSLYVGDGSSIVRPLVRRQGELLFGHTTIRAQLGWCAEEGVGRALFTHCGGAVLDRERDAARAVRDLGRARGVEARLACDGLRLVMA